MISTSEWQKCDNKDCGVVAFIRLRDPVYNFQVNVCNRHYEELRHTRDWEIEDIDND